MTKRTLQEHCIFLCVWKIKDKQGGADHQSNWENGGAFSFSKKEYGK